MPLRAWFQEVAKADWSSPAEVKAAYRSASIVGNDRVVFNIGGNKYRLVVRVNYAFRIVYVRFIGTHKQYDQIDASEV
jgi:mRNA interferase HigB